MVTKNIYTLTISIHLFYVKGVRQGILYAFYL